MFFDANTSYYVLLYTDKDYSAEAAYVASDNREQTLQTNGRLAQCGYLGWTPVTGSWMS